ncbi:MAG: riboflavin kinase, partial [Eubacteriales bacterium]
MFSCVPFQPQGRFVYALGSFDGVHIGHRALLRDTVEMARSLHAVPSVWTFGDSSYKSDGERFFLTDTEQRLALFAECGIEAVVFEDFSSVRDMSPRDFVNELLAGVCRCAGAVCGFNYRFGAGGQASPETLGDYLDKLGIPLRVSAPVLYGGQPVSSTRIRRAVADGDCETAAALLGRRYSVRTKVVRGYQLGRTIGIPTVNQIFAPEQLIPRHGVYAAVCDTGGGVYPCVTNIGMRPTVAV